MEWERKKEIYTWQGQIIQGIVKDQKFHMKKWQLWKIYMHPSIWVLRLCEYVHVGLQAYGLHASGYLHKYLYL